MKLIDFTEHFSTEESCEHHLKTVCEKHEVVCNKCGGTAHYWNNSVSILYQSVLHQLRTQSYEILKTYNNNICTLLSFVVLFSCTTRNPNNQTENCNTENGFTQSVDSVLQEPQLVSQTDTIMSDSVLVSTKGSDRYVEDIIINIDNKHSSQIECFYYSTYQIVDDSLIYLIGDNMQCTVAGNKKAETRVDKQLEKVTYLSKNKYLFELKYKICGDNTVYIAQCTFTNVGDCEYVEGQLYENGIPVYDVDTFPDDYPPYSN